MNLRPLGTILLIYAIAFFIYSLNSHADKADSAEKVESAETVKKADKTKDVEKAKTADKKTALTPKTKPQAKTCGSNERYNQVFAIFDLHHGDEPLGKVKVRLFNKHAPNTVNNFVCLAEGSKAFHEFDKAKGKEGELVQRPYFDGLTFHRIIPGFMIQGGCPLGNGRGSPKAEGFPFKDEFHPDLRHNKPGILSMANSGPNTNGSQFFITVAERPHLDDKHSVFGEVIEGMDIIMKASKVPTDPSARPRTPVVMKSITIERN